jgi:hypothetical protein
MVALTQVGSANLRNKHTMKNEITTLAVTLSLTGAAVYLLSRANPAINADSVVGFGVILMLLAMAAVEYRITWKKLFGR